MSVYHHGLEPSGTFGRLEFRPPSPKARALYPALTILSLSLLLWSIILIPIAVLAGWV